jgi:hypothetical protein
LLEDGWASAHIALIDDLSAQIQAPEAKHRVFFVAVR